MNTQTTIIGVIINIFNWIFLVIGALGVLFFSPLVITSIVFFVMSSSETIPEKKRSLKKKGWFFIILPVAIIIVSILGNVIINIIKNLSNN